MRHCCRRAHMFQWSSFELPVIQYSNLASRVGDPNSKSEVRVEDWQSLKNKAITRWLGDEEFREGRNIAGSDYVDRFDTLTLDAPLCGRGSRRAWYEQIWCTLGMPASYLFWRAGIRNNDGVKGPGYEIKSKIKVPIFYDVFKITGVIVAARGMLHNRKHA